MFTRLVHVRVPVSHCHDYHLDSCASASCAHHMDTVLQFPTSELFSTAWASLLSPSHPTEDRCNFCLRCLLFPLRAISEASYHSIKTRPSAWVIPYVHIFFCWRLWGWVLPLFPIERGFLGHFLSDCRCTVLRILIFLSGWPLLRTALTQWKYGYALLAPDPQFISGGQRHNCVALSVQSEPV